MTTPADTTSAETWAYYATRLATILREHRLAASAQGRLADLLDQLARRVLTADTERALLYDEVNRALGSSAPAAWDRVAAKLAAREAVSADTPEALTAELCGRIGHDDIVMASSTMTRDGVTVRCLRCGYERIIPADSGTLANSLSGEHGSVGGASEDVSK